MKNIIAAAVAGIGILAGTLAIAADDPIAVRQSLMKNNGAAAGALGKMAKGEVAFDAVAAQLALRTIHAVSFAYGHYFPEGSQTGMDTKALPAIWSDRAGFDAALAKLQDAAKAAVASPPATREELGATMGSIGGACGGCHKAFRAS
jgi:cytochrome c556